MKALKSKGFSTPADLVKFVEINNIPVDNIFSIVAGDGYIALFIW